MEVLPEPQEPQEPSDAATLHIIVKRDDVTSGREGGEGWTGPHVLGWLRWFVPAAVWVRVTVPGAEAGRLLRMLERVAIAVTWAATVIGTLFGAQAAHLPPTGTTIVVVLEIVVPPVVLRARRGDDDQ